MRTNTHRKTAVFANDLFYFELAGLSGQSLDLFFSCVAKAKNKGESDIVFSFKELCDTALIPETHRYPSRVSPYLDRLAYESCMCRARRIKKNGGWTIYTIFNRFDYDPTDLDEYFSIRINPDFLAYFNDLTKDFTVVELVTLCSTKSKYAKLAYLYMQKFRTTGKWEISKKQFQDVMGYPASYKNAAMVKRKVIDPIVDNLKDIYPDLKVVEKKGAASKRAGRRPVTGYVFVWSPAYERKEWADFKKQPVKGGRKQKADLPTWYYEQPENDLTEPDWNPYEDLGKLFDKICDPVDRERQKAELTELREREQA
jgi:plasmid replication initiation protein